MICTNYWTQNGMWGFQEWSFILGQWDYLLYKILNYLKESECLMKKLKIFFYLPEADNNNYYPRGEKINI